jgi:hypothetical protein
MTGQEAIYLLKDKGVKRIRIEYSGGGDSGAIDSIGYLDELDSFIAIKYSGMEATDIPPAIENLAYVKLNNIEDWWNNDGGVGYMIIDLNDLSYQISNEIRYTEYETYNHNGDLSELLED